MATVIKNPNLLPRLWKILSEDNLSKSSKVFVDDLHKFCAKRGGLTEGQLRCFEKIESAFTDEMKQKRADWIARFTPEKRELLYNICQYYRRINQQNYTNYYASIIEPVLAGDESYIPSEKQFIKITENKYSKGWLEALESDPLFEEKAVARLRQTQRVPRRFRNKMVAIIKANSELPISHAKGAKRYTVLPFGESQTIIVEERDIKKYRKKKK